MGYILFTKIRNRRRIGLGRKISSFGGMLSMKRREKRDSPA